MSAEVADPLVVIVTASAVPTVADDTDPSVRSTFEPMSSAFTRPVAPEMVVLAVPEVTITFVRPDIRPALIVAAPAATLLLVSERFSIPDVLITGSVEAAVYPEIPSCSMSVPAPPTSESPFVKVAVVAELVSTAMNVSLPAPPVNAAPVSKPVVSGLVQQKAIYLICLDIYTIHFESFYPSKTLPRLRAHPKASMQRS